jgi:2-succinyl-6-hydroxy-2,4-cyclohexadiene-1-carboxylate synthase
MITVNGMAYHVTLTGHGEPLALLHGFTGSSASWGELIGWLSGYFTVIAVDLPGHGMTDAPSDPARYAMPRVAADLRALFRACGADAPHLVGYSMGGRLALYYALHHPVRSLMLESASPGLADADERAARKAADDVLADEIERDGVAAFVERWEALPLFASQARLPETVREAQRAIRLANRPHGLANSLRGMGTGVQPSLWGRLGELNVPVLLLCGALDEKFTAIARAMSGRIRDARLNTLPDAGHTVHLEQPLQFRDALLRFVRDAGRRRMV